MKKVKLGWASIERFTSWIWTTRWERGRKEYATPYTNYNVEVVQNIKGQLNQDKSIIIQKCGGINQDKESYVIKEGDYLPEVGNTYIFIIFAQDDGTN